MEIADEIKQRPEAGARRLVAEYRERLYQVAYRLCLNAADADDLVFRTMQRAMERIGGYRPTGSFYQWLYAIMVHIPVFYHGAQYLTNGPSRNRPSSSTGCTLL